MIFPVLLRKLGDERNPQSYQEFGWQPIETQDLKKKNTSKSGKVAHQ